MYILCNSFCISALDLLLTYLLYCLLFTVMIVYYIELSFGCCDAYVFPFVELIKTFLILVLDKQTYKQANGTTNITK